MITLNVDELNDFYKIASSIRKSVLHPELSYLFLSKGKLTKSNMAITCTKSISVISDDGEEDIELLLDESKLYQFIKATFATEIKIQRENEKIIISDNKYHMNFAYMDPTTYPQKLEFPTGDGMLVTKEIIDAIAVARAFSSNDENATNFRCVHLKDNFICAVSFGLVYIKEFKFKFPETSLLNTYCDIITRFSSARFYKKETDNYYYYKFEGGLFFAFIQSIETQPGISKMHEVLKTVPEESFTVAKKDITDFLELANSITPSKQVICSFKEDEALGSILSLQDNDYSTGLKKEIKVGGLISPFSFNSRTSGDAFSALPQEEFVCTESKHTLIIRDKNSWACISGVQDN